MSREWRIQQNTAEYSRIQPKKKRSAACNKAQLQTRERLQFSRANPLHLLSHFICNNFASDNFN